MDKVSQYSDCKALGNLGSFAPKLQEHDKLVRSYDPDPILRSRSCKDKKDHSRPLPGGEPEIDGAAIGDFLNKVMLTGKNEVRGVLLLHGVDVNSRCDLVEILRQSINIQRRSSRATRVVQQVKPANLCFEGVPGCSFFYGGVVEKGQLEVVSNRCEEMSSVARWRESDLHATLEVKKHDLDCLRTQNKDMSDKYDVLQWDLKWVMQDAILRMVEGNV
nr:hypothetical protein [Tanacetum cinerariifolium]